MFAVGENIIYGTKGVCQVEDITTVSMQGMPTGTEYYILRPWNQSGSRIFVSVDNQKTLMRPVLSREEASDLIEEMPEIDELWVDNDKMREERYKECIRTCQCRELVRMIKTLYLRKQERVKAGKKITTTDERYLKMAEEHLYSELSLVLDIPMDKMEGYITEKIESMHVL